MGDESRESSVQMAATDKPARTFLLCRDLGLGAERTIAFTFLVIVTSVVILLWVKLDLDEEIFVVGFIIAVAICGYALLMLAVKLLDRILLTKVVVGVEGILVRHRRSRRLLRYEEITSVEQVQLTGEVHRPRRVKIGLVSGASVDLTTLFFDYDTEPAEVVNEFERRRDAWMARQGYPHEEALARGDRSGAAWAEALRRLGAGAPGAYRAGAVDRLWALLDDSGAHPATRAAAAVALYRVDDDRSRLRLRIAAAAMASTETRSRLERIADAADDAALAEALDALHDEDSTLELQRGRRKSLAEDANA